MNLTCSMAMFSSPRSPCWRIFASSSSLSSIDSATYCFRRRSNVLSDSSMQFLSSSTYAHSQHFKYSFMGGLYNVTVAKMRLTDQLIIRYQLNSPAIKQISTDLIFRSSDIVLIARQLPSQTRFYRASACNACRARYYSANSVCLSVCLSSAGTVSKQMYTSSYLLTIW